MPDRVPSDHASVSTYRAHVERSGGTRRLVVRVPDEADLAAGDIVRVVLDRDEYHARVGEDSSGLLLRGAYDTRGRARDPADSPNRLAEWIKTHDLEDGSAVDFDEVVPGELYGVRVPGERAIYEVSDGPDQSLRDIADSLDG